MHYFVCFRLQGLYVRQLVETKPELRERAVVVMRGGLVLDADIEAQLRGIEPGMPVSQAKAILDRAAFVEWEEKAYEKARDRWLDLLLPYTNVLEPAEQHMAFLDLSDHPQPAEIAGLAAEALANKGYQATLGAGSSRWIAELATVFPDDPRSVNAPREFLAELPVGFLTPIRSEYRTRLEFLGCRVIGDVARLTEQTLRVQFGEREGHLINLAAQGRLFQNIKGAYPDAAIFEGFRFDGAVSGEEEFFHGVDILAKRIGRRLLETQSQGQEAHVFLEMEEGEIHTLTRQFAKPIAGAAACHSALVRMLAEQVDSPVAAIRVLLPHLQCVSVAQKNLLEPAQGAVLEGIIRQLRGCFGQKAIVRATEMRTPRRVRILKAWSRALGIK